MTPTLLLNRIEKAWTLFVAIAMIAAVGLVCASSVDAFAATKGTSLKSVKGATKSIKVSWKSAQKISGYEVGYKLSGASKWKIKTVKASKKSLTIKKLKAGKRYYAKVRTYTVVSGKKQYSSWSKAKSAKTKAKAKKKSSNNSGGGTVYRTRTGAKYHMGWCPTLRSKIATTRSEARSMGLGACKVCNP